MEDTGASLFTSNNWLLMDQYSCCLCLSVVFQLCRLLHISQAQSANSRAGGCVFAVIAVLSSAEAVKVYFPACGCTVLAEHTEVKSNDTIQPGK